jgi:simple sugar transport system permease protein
LARNTTKSRFNYCCYSFICDLVRYQKAYVRNANKITGSAPRAAKFAGFDDKKTIWFSLLISGGVAGLAGLFEIIGPAGQITPGLPQFYGFTAIIVAFLARLHPIGIIFSALLIALTYLGGENVQIDFNLPSSITNVFQGMLLFYFLACDILIQYKLVLLKRHDKDYE